MCGLVGLFDSRECRPTDEPLLRRMSDSLSHRGPDGEGQYVADGIGLGHRRLAIIDLDGGHQPMFNEDGSVAVVFNGEIYNFQQLATELKGLGHVFRSGSDTEVIVHAWEQWGADCVTRFRGMFAFALWDQPRETLFLARDRVGKKPLYYSELPDGMVVFGSELKALRCHPRISNDLDLQAVEEYFAFGYVPDPRSIYRGISKLPPAHTLVWRRGRGPVLASYWDVAFTPTGASGAEEAKAELVARLREAVRMRLIADVPLGAFLSGGVDSSGVVALMSGMVSGPVRTFSIGFGERDFDETAYARQVAQRYHTDHHERQVDPDAFDLVDRLAGIFDEPFGDSSAIPTFRVCALARETVTVALSGDGGDEVFAGYRRYPWHHREEMVRRLLPAVVRRPVFGLLGAVYPKLDWAPRVLRARTTFRELALDSVGSYFGSVSVLDDATRASIFSRRFRRDLQGYNAVEVMRRHMTAAATDDPLQQAQYADFKTWLPGDILVKVDRTSMANSLEVRAPLLDHDLVEWGLGLGSGLKLSGGEGKYLLKRALEPYVPRALLYRPKQGFSVPLAAWFRGPLHPRLRAAVSSQVLTDSGYFEVNTLHRMVEQHRSGRWDHSAALWVVLMFESFLRASHSGRGTRTMESGSVPAV